MKWNAWDSRLAERHFASAEGRQWRRFGPEKYNICDILTDEETVFLVNKKLSIKDIFTIHYDDLLCLYKNARELSSKFDTDKVDAILDKLYADIKLQASKIYQPEDILSSIDIFGNLKSSICT